jgi:hypothetical protein
MISDGDSSRDLGQQAPVTPSRDLGSDVQAETSGSVAQAETSGNDV